MALANLVLSHESCLPWIGRWAGHDSRFHVRPRGLGIECRCDEPRWGIFWVVIWEGEVGGGGGDLAALFFLGWAGLGGVRIGEA